MNIYDFDDTIYEGDSTIDFIKYSIKKHPIYMIKCITLTIIPTIKYLLGKGSIEKVKSSLFSYMIKIEDKEKYVNNFCVMHIKKIKSWYKESQKESDIIISASLDFWLIPFCKMLNIKNLICTRMDKNYKVIGKNCKGKEKIVRLNKEFPNINVNNAYSDSLSDIPMFNVANKGYIVNKDQLTEYNKDIHIKKEKLFNKDFIIFIFCGGCGSLTNFIISSLSSIFLDPVISYILGYSISLAVTYYLNISLIFKRNIKFIDFIKFIISYIPNFIIQLICVNIFVNLLHIPPVISYAISIIIGLPVSFIFVKLFAFRKVKTNEKN